MILIMSVEDNDNLYIIEEEKGKETDNSSDNLENSPLNYAAYHEIEDEAEEIADKTEKVRSPFSFLIKIMFNPVEGWKSLRRSGLSIDSFQSGCFYPLLALMAISKFVDLFYTVDTNISQIITKAVISFVAFFFGNFCIQMVMSWILPKEMAQKFEEKFGKEFTLVALSTLVLFSILTNILPMIWPILIFLPIWTLYIMFKGVRFFKFPVEKEMKFFILVSCAMIGIPSVIEWALYSIIPA